MIWHRQCISFAKEQNANEIETCDSYSSHHTTEKQELTEITHTHTHVYIYKFPFRKTPKKRRKCDTAKGGHNIVMRSQHTALINPDRLGLSLLRMNYVVNTVVLGIYSFTNDEYNFEVGLQNYQPPAWARLGCALFLFPSLYLCSRDSLYSKTIATSLFNFEIYVCTHMPTKLHLVHTLHTHKHTPGEPKLFGLKKIEEIVQKAAKMVRKKTSHYVLFIIGVVRT